MLILNRIKNRLKKILEYPDMIISYFISKTSRKRWFDRISELNGINGIQGHHFILSFDCDTIEDIEVVEKVHNRLVEMGIFPVYAVPGELLIKGKNVYKKLYESGSSFVNHGYKSHTSRESTGKYVSLLDYPDLHSDEVKEDIVAGHNCIVECLDSVPNGFRTPHFGNYQKKENLKLIYSVLNQLGYKYSTSTIPYFAWKHGSVHTNGQIQEIPVSGLLTEPLRIFDSFLFCNQDTGVFDNADYYNNGVEILRYLVENTRNSVLNIYSDPSQIHDSEDFFSLMKLISEKMTVTDYEKLLDNIDVRK